MFLEGILTQLGAFAMQANVEPAEVYVRLTLSDGDAQTFDGLSTISPFGDNDWGMIFGKASKGAKALVIRERDVLKAEFEADSIGPEHIGFASELIT